MKVSVVIPAHNEEAALPACLKALAHQVTRHKLKIIIVNNASTDQTTATTLEYANRLGIKDLTVIEEPRLGRGAARRRDFAEAKTDIILSTDADRLGRETG